jgi:hypothetical protein
MNYPQNSETPDTGTNPTVDLLADANAKIIVLEHNLAEAIRTLEQLEDWVRLRGSEPALAYDDDE